MNDEINSAISLLWTRTSEWLMQIIQHKALCIDISNLHYGKVHRALFWNCLKFLLIPHNSPQNISMLVVLLYSWQINVNSKKFQVLGDVYYGVQVAYYAIIGTQISTIVLSVVLIVGINSVSIFFVVISFHWFFNWISRVENFHCYRKTKNFQDPLHIKFKKLPVFTQKNENSFYVFECCWMTKLNLILN